MQKGIIVKNISNLYNVETENNIFLCEARGKFKKSGITPAVGDRVQINSIDEQKGIIEEYTTIINPQKISGADLKLLILLKLYLYFQ